MTTAVFKGNPFGIDTDAFKFVDDIVHFRLTRRECLQAVSIVSRATVVVAALVVIGEKGTAWVNNLTGTSHIEKSADTKALQVWTPSRLSRRASEDESKGRYQQAIADLNQALKLDEGTTKSPLTRAGMFYDIAWNYEKLGDKASAHQACVKGSAAMAQAMAMKLFPGMDKGDAAKMVEQLKATANGIDPAETAVPTTRSEIMTLHGGARMSSFDRGAMLCNISCYVAKAGALSLHGQLCEGLNMQDQGEDGGDATVAAVDAPEAPNASDSMNMMRDVTPNCAAESIEQPLPSQSIARLCPSV